MATVKCKYNRIGEKRINNFGSEMVIVEYRGALDIDVYFPEYNWTAKSVQYDNFKNGNIKCPYERRYYGIGYIGEGKYKVCKNGKMTKCYNAWHSMLQRCHDEKYHKKQPTYIDCEVSKEWLNYQNFAEWYYNNYYEIEGEKMALDKDILVKGNKIYSSDTCIFVPNNINVLFTKSDKARGKYPIGVTYHKQARKFMALCNVYDFEENKIKRKNLGLYDSSQQAFEVYKEFKERYIKKVANYYKDKIPSKLYDSLYNYEVEIND